MTRPDTVDDFRTRTARLALLLTLVHAVPVVWLTPVSAGTAPTAALLAVGLAGLFSFDGEGLAMGLMALGPALVYLALAVLLARLLTWGAGRLPRRLGFTVLALLCVVPLVAVYFPIYVAGGHSSTTAGSLVDLVSGYGPPWWLLAYWVGVQLVIGGLLILQLANPGSPSWPGLLRCTPWVLRVAGLCFVVVLVTANYRVVICRPFAHLGFDVAQVCVARAGGADARYWYERAARDGNAEALVWIVDNTPDRNRRLEWLRLGADAGVPAMQYELYQFLQSYGGDSDRADAERWLQAAVTAGYGPAQMAEVERLTAEIRQSDSVALLSRRSTLLDAAVANGSALARLRLAEHLSRGSMGYPVDLPRARRYYETLVEEGGPEERAPMLRLVGGSYQDRLDEIDRWQAGLAAGDIAVLAELGRLYLGSEFPGPGVREQGLALLEQAAESDPEVRRSLIVMLRTGSDGADRDLHRARGWLLRAASDGEVDAMARVVDNYLSGREGFPQDLPEARRWIDVQRDHYEQHGGGDAARQLEALAAQTRYIERLASITGSALLGADELRALGQRTDADSLYRVGLQQLTVGGPAVRAEGIRRLQAAADLGHAEASWRLMQVYERGMSAEVDPAAARRELERAAALHHFEATKTLAARYEYGSDGFEQDLPRAIGMYEAALDAGHDNRYGWNLSPEIFNHFAWLESRLKQARLKAAQLTVTP